MTVSEPTTLLTDWVLAAVAIALGARLVRAGRPAVSHATRLWAGAFLVGAGAAVAGGVVHGFAGSLPRLAHALLWKVVLVGCGFAGSLLLAGAALATLRATSRHAVLVAATGQLVAYLALVAGSDDIRIAAWNGAATIAAILVLGVVGAQRQAPQLSWLVLALALSGAGIAAQRLRAPAPPPFNHNDVCHLIQTAALWPFYRVALELRDREA